MAYAYDELNRLAAVGDAHLGITAYTYDNVGNLQGCTYPNYVHAEYQYDALNRLTNLAGDRLGTAIANYAYLVAASGNRTNAVEQLFSSSLNSHPSTINRIYTYDALYRLTNETINGTPATGAAGYNYDPVGNRLGRGITSLPLSSQTFTFDANDRLNTDTYDANGNTLLGAGFGQSLADEYDFENRLVTRHTSSCTVHITYDGDGNRVSKTLTTSTNAITTFYVVDELNPSGYAQVLEEHTSLNSQPSTLDCVYTYGHTLISQQRLSTLNSQPSTSFYGYDGHGSVRYLTDTNAAVTDTYDYDAFGCPRDTKAMRREFAMRMEARRASESEQDWKPLRRGWCWGGKDFRQELLEQMSEQTGPNHGGEERRESEEAWAEQVVRSELKSLRWTPAELAQRRKGDLQKLAIARRLRRETTMTLKWIADRLNMGAAGSLANLLRNAKIK